MTYIFNYTILNKKCQLFFCATKAIYIIYNKYIKIGMTFVIPMRIFI